MKILVTGGTGFIGSNLCERLVEQGHDVLCLDNNYTGRTKNVEHLLKQPNFHLIFHDINKPFNIDWKIDRVYNLACPASPKHYQGDHAIETTKTCTIGVMNVLNFALKKNARVLQASTSEVYGDPLQHPQTEAYFGNVNPNGVRSCYDEGKRCAESLFMDYNRLYGLDTRIVRIFNTYGENMDKEDGRVISNFVNQALNNEDITVYGRGEQARSFCHVDDTVIGLIRAMECDCVEPINIGNPNEVTIIDLAMKIIEMTKSSSQIIFHKIPQDDPTRRKPDINKAKKLLNWTPSVDIKIGLRRTIEYFKHS